MAAGEAVFAPTGELCCRLCANTELIDRTDAAVARAAGPAFAPDRPETTAGYWFLAPIALFAVWTVAQLAGQLLQPKSCSELGCLGLVLVPMAGMVIALPCGVAAVMGVPAVARRRVAFGALGAVLLMLGSCITVVG